jgi:catalase
VVADIHNARWLLNAVRRAATLDTDGHHGSPGGCPLGRKPPHGRGIGCSGRFFPSAAGRRRFTGALFDADALPVDVRFSTTIAGALGAATRVNNVGLALWVGSDQGIPRSPGSLVAANLALFPTADPYLFPLFLDATHRSAQAPPGAERSDPLTLFAAQHPETVSGTLLYGRALRRGLPTSYAEATYHGAHAFWFSERAGGTALARYHWEPFAGDRTRWDPAADVHGMGDWSADPGLLADALVERIQSQGAARFTLALELATPSERPGDPSQSWPEALVRFVAGELVLDHCRGDDFEDRLSAPWEPPRGIARDPADAVMDARSDVYPLARTPDSTL